MAVQNISQPFESNVDASVVHAGMNIFSRNGESLGKVTEVWAYIPTHGYVAKSRFAIADYGPVRGTAHLLEGADGYVQATQRSVVRREDERELFIPLEDIEDVVIGEALLVGYDKDTCHAQCGRRPESLDNRP